MGKRIRVQRRGRGTSTFRALTHRRVAPVRYPPTVKWGKESLKGEVRRLLHDPGRGAPVALIRCENGLTFFNVACEGMFEGQEVEIGKDARVVEGNVLPLGLIPEGTMVYNVEKTPDDGGRFARASGGYATVISRTPAGTALKLTSGKIAYLNSASLATVGVVAGGGRTDKHFMKAGERYHLLRTKGRKYPLTKGVKMVAASHPFGGGRHKHTGKPKTVSRLAPPGRKVGLIAARRTGRGKKPRAARLG